MNAKANREEDNQPVAIEDLSAGNAEEVKGGDAIYKMHRIGHTSADYNG